MLRTLFLPQWLVDCVSGNGDINLLTSPPQMLLFRVSNHRPVHFASFTYFFKMDDFAMLFIYDLATYECTPMTPFFDPLRHSHDPFLGSSQTRRDASGPTSLMVSYILPLQVGRFVDIRLACLHLLISSSLSAPVNM